MTLTLTKVRQCKDKIVNLYLKKTCKISRRRAYYLYSSHLQFVNTELMKYNQKPESSVKKRIAENLHTITKKKQLSIIKLEKLLQLNSPKSMLC